MAVTPPDFGVWFTGRAEGDMGHAGRWVGVDEIDSGVAARRAAVHPGPWTWLRQVHGARVVVVKEPGQHAGEVADAAVTSEPGCVLAVLTADCAPVALVSDEGVLGVAHAGWRGLVAGVLEATVAEMRRLGAVGISALLGPCIHAECYEFGAGDLEAVAARLGPSVQARTASGGPALDVPAAVRAALGRVAVTAVDDVGVCTACAPGHYSHRARGDAARQALVAWISPSV